MSRLAADPPPCPTTDDAFLGGALRILQPRSAYRAGIDGILLAAAVPASDGDKVLDVGAGVGTAGLSVARRLQRTHVTLLERDAQLAELARKNVERNGLGDRARVIEADLMRPLNETAALAAAAESFDHVLANPPFHVEGRGTASGDPVKAGANAMPQDHLERWARFMAAMVRPGGAATLVHRADALHAVLSALAGRFGGTVVLPIHPRMDAPASRILVRAIKGSRADLQLRRGLVLHNADHSFRAEIDAILRHGAALDLENAQGQP